MQVSREELLHIANLADLKIEENEIDKYLNNLQDILNYTEVLNSIDLENCEETIGENEYINVFRKDEVEEFEDTKSLLENAPNSEREMFSIPKVIN